MKMKMYRIKRFFRQIKNLIRWVPVLWNQFDFDYSYSIDVFKFQLQNTVDFLNSDKAHTMGAKQNARRLQMIIDLITKVYDDGYAEEYLEIMNKRWGEGCMEMHFKDRPTNPNLIEMYLEYETWDNAEEVRQFETIEIRKSVEKQERAHKLVWELVEHNIQKMWD